MPILSEKLINILWQGTGKAFFADNVTNVLVTSDGTKAINRRFVPLKKPQALIGFATINWVCNYKKSVTMNITIVMAF